MASEISITTQLAADKGSLAVKHVKTYKADLTSTVYAAGAQSIPTTAAAAAAGTAIMLGSVTTPGYSYVATTDTTNYDGGRFPVAGIAWQG